MDVNNTQNAPVKNTSLAALFTILGLVLLAALTRWIPHPPNFTAIGAMAIFAGAYFPKRSMAVLIPLAALLLGDFVIGFHNTMFYVYGAVALVALISFQVLKKTSAVKTGGMAVLSSLLFFVITNLGVWAQGGMYSMDLQGLTNCFVMALPFFQNQILGDLFYTAVIFGAWEVLRRQAYLLKSA